MSKVVQHLGRISRTCRCAITTALLSALVLMPAVVVAQSSTSTKFKVIHTFGDDGQNGAFARSGVITDEAGNLYGVAAGGNVNDCAGWGCGVVFKLDSSGKYRVLHRFTGGTDGGLPTMDLVIDAAGNLYGTTAIGGNISQCVNYGPGCGVVFKIASGGTFTVLYTFQGGADGGLPYLGRLALDDAGNVYGAARNGGENFSGCLEGDGCGVIYKVDPSGNETVLYTFTGGTDGAYPNGMVRDTSGNLYGTATQGGSAGSCNFGYPVGCGTVWKLDTNNNLTVLHSFTGQALDGQYPYSAVILDKKGNLYGVTNGGGNQVCSWSGGCGAVFKVSARGKETILHFFESKSNSDGVNPIGTPALDKSGVLYGTTQYGGNYNKYPCTPLDSIGCGVVFKIEAGKETIVYGLKGGKEGAQLVGGPFLDAKGNIYGTTTSFGSMNGEACSENGGCGTVFKITP